jgi:hypothetical protein
MKCDAGDSSDRFEKCDSSAWGAAADQAPARVQASASSSVGSGPRGAEDGRDGWAGTEGLDNSRWCGSGGVAASGTWPPHANANIALNLRSISATCSGVGFATGFRYRFGFGFVPGDAAGGGGGWGRAGASSSGFVRDDAGFGFRFGFGLKSEFRFALELECGL